MKKKLGQSFRNFYSNLSVKKVKVVFFVSGIASIIWFLIRVIPKPSRATYPCMRATAPLASSFIAYLLGLGTFTLLFRKAKDHILKAKYMLGSILIISGLFAGLVTIVYTNMRIQAQELQLKQAPNQPIGQSRGIFPSRVVWVHDVKATNEYCTNSSGDYWHMDENTNQSVVNKMLSDGLQQLTGKNSDADAWDALFKDFNKNLDQGDQGYTAGEKIAIKINLNGEYGSVPLENLNTSPQICIAILDQLVNTVGVAEKDIHIGDPNVSMNAVTYDKLNYAFPDVIYWGDNEAAGLKKPVQSETRIFKTSDGDHEDYLPQSYLDATYLINIPVLKKHHAAGISIAAKNHFGSIAEFSGGAFHLHYNLPSNGRGDVNNGEYQQYRCFVDLIGHEELGGKTMLYLVDGLWSSTNWGHPPIKWRMDPFSNDYPNTLFLAQDPVALESVCYDFLFEEFDESHPTEGGQGNGTTGPFPRYAGVDDYLHQAADPSVWAPEIKYDPEADGTQLGSLGVHEHWNNATDKQYSRNLGKTVGIELISSYVVTSIGTTSIPEGFELRSVYPNPASSIANIPFSLGSLTNVRLSIYNSNGILMDELVNEQMPEGEHSIVWNIEEVKRRSLPDGSYLCHLQCKNDQGSFALTSQILIIR